MEFSTAAWRLREKSGFAFGYAVTNHDLSYRLRS
jgi:hypothetical protein